MKAFVCALAVVLAICSVAQGVPTHPGLKLALNQQSIQFFVGQALPLGFQTMLRTVILPDLDATIKVPEVGDVNVTLKKMRLTSFEYKDEPEAYAHIVSGNNMLYFKQKMRLNMDLSWYYVLEDKSSNYGTGIIYVDGDWSGDVKLMTDTTGHPSTKFGETGVGFSTPVFKLSGGPDWLNDAVFTNFHPAVMRVVNDNLMTVIVDVIEPGLNDVLAKTSLQEKIDETFSIDYTLVNPDGIIATSDGLLVANTAGEIFPTGGQPGNMPGEFVELPNNATGQQYQIIISENTVLSFMQTAINAGLAQIVLSKDMFSSHFADLFTTDFFAKYAPGIAVKYGNGTEVEIFLAIRQLGDFMFDKNGLGVKSPIEMTVRAQNNSTGAFEDAFTLSVASAVSGIVKVDDVKIFGHVFDISAVLSLVSSKVGDVDVANLNFLIDSCITFGLSTINEILEKGTPLPELPHVQLVHPTIVYGQDYAVVATDAKIQ